MGDAGPRHQRGRPVEQAGVQALPGHLAAALARIRLDRPEYAAACAELRELLIASDGGSVAALAARLF